MTPIAEAFYKSELADLHRRLLQHPVAQQNLSGDRIRFDGRVLGIDIDQIEFPSFELSAHEFAQLFCVFNGSRVHAQVERLVGGDLSPPGYYLTIINTQVIAPGHKNKLGIVQREGVSSELFISDMHIDHFYLDAHGAPALLGTISFALCAIAALRAGLGRITLIAADGRGGGGFVGIKVWPKFGFDAPLDVGEIAADERFSACHTVQDLMAVDADWWAIHGTQRLMAFDLTPYSISWGSLLDYLCKKI